jgi:hypothetical protein
MIASVLEGPGGSVSSGGAGWPGGTSSSYPDRWRAKSPSLLLEIVMPNAARRSKKLPTIFTIGHSTRPIAEFLALLQQVAVDMLVDVRSIPRSRTNPQFNVDTLSDTLADAGISYRHLPALGGLRHRKKGAAPSLNTFWQVAAFRNYADYAATGTFREGLVELRALAGDNCCAIMCAEAVWWRFLLNGFDRSDFDDGTASRTPSASIRFSSEPSRGTWPKRLMPGWPTSRHGANHRLARKCDHEYPVTSRFAQ